MLSVLHGKSEPTSIGWVKVRLRAEKKRLPTGDHKGSPLLYLPGVACISV